MFIISACCDCKKTESNPCKEIFEHSRLSKCYEIVVPVNSDSNPNDSIPFCGENDCCLSMGGVYILETQDCIGPWDSAERMLDCASGCPVHATDLPRWRLSLSAVTGKWVLEGFFWGGKAVNYIGNAPLDSEGRYDPPGDLNYTASGSTGACLWQTFPPLTVEAAACPA